jgi:pilus assembly protein CpaF
MSSAKQIFLQISEKIQSSMVIDLAALPSKSNTDTIEKIVRTKLEQDHAADRPEIHQRVLAEFFANGPIEDLLVDESITEIIINGANHICFEKGGALQTLNDSFFSEYSFQNFIQRLSAEARIQANLDRPFADGHWRQYRVHLIIPPLAKPGPVLSLRRHPTNSWSFSRFAEMAWAPADALHILKSLVEEQKSFLIVGSTGSGKTSVLSACLQLLSKNERIVAIEDTSELHLPNPSSVKLLARQDVQNILRPVDQAELLRQALRMRPDRIVMGEVRGAEAKDLLMALSTGHRGGMATLHAENARQALYRLEMLVQLGAPQWSLYAIRNLIRFGIDAIVCVEKLNGKRRLKSIDQIVSLEENGLSVDQVWPRSSLSACHF